jgi:hypothetical protein
MPGRLARSGMCGNWMTKRGIIRHVGELQWLTRATSRRGDIMTMMQCEYRDHVITAEVMEHPGTPTPWAGGCRISNSQGQTTRRMALPVGHAFMAELEQAQRASIAHGKWLVDQCLDQGRQLFDRAA